MAISCDINVDNPTPGHGDTVTFSYSVDGNDPIDSSSATVSGAAVVGGVRYAVSTTMTAPGTPAASEQFEVPTSDQSGWIFLAGDTPSQFTCTIP
jgi:hypothetical protein